jgi:diadenosine tetraphosphate (Ap4A) HIT family hydrolase
MSVVRKGVTYAAANSTEVIDCLFCRIARKDPNEPATIVGETDKFVAFKTISPTTSKHYLVVPRQHVQNISALKANDVAMVQEMIQFGRQILGEDGADGYFCFQVPPFNMIDHLHMHAIGKSEEMGWLSLLMYGQHFPWCTTAAALIESLADKQ